MINFLLVKPQCLCTNLQVTFSRGTRWLIYYRSWYMYMYYRLHSYLIPHAQPQSVFVTHIVPSTCSKMRSENPVAMTMGTVYSLVPRLLPPHARSLGTRLNCIWVWLLVHVWDNILVSLSKLYTISIAQMVR